MSTPANSALFDELNQLRTMLQQHQTMAADERQALTKRLLEIQTEMADSVKLATLIETGKQASLSLDDEETETTEQNPGKKRRLSQASHLAPLLTPSPGLAEERLHKTRSQGSEGFPQSQGSQDSLWLLHLLPGGSLPIPSSQPLPAWGDTQYDSLPVLLQISQPLSQQVPTDGLEPITPSLERIFS